MQPEAIVDLHYLPCINFFTLLTRKKTVAVEISNYYEKQTCRNRCYVLSANKVQRLSVPIIKPSTTKIPYSEVQIDYRERWQDIHWRTIASAYGKAPYFEHYADDFRRIIYSGEPLLAQLNRQILTICLKFLQLPVNITATSTYLASYGAEVMDLRGQISCLPEPDADKTGYVQLFGKNFVHNLSVIDLLFCEGPQSIFYLQKNALTSDKT